MRLLLVASLFLLQSVQAQAAVDPKVHKLCIEAKDYQGCVRAMLGDTSPTTRLIQSQGADIAEGNQCPSGFAYVGGGNCMEVKCAYSPSGYGYDQGHDQRVAGKADWGCKYSFWQGAGVMQLVGSARASVSLKCPPGEPVIGYNSTCQNAPPGWVSPSEKAAKEAKEGPICDFKLKGYACSYSKYLDANPAMKAWADANPEMAKQERVRLQSID